MTGVSTLALAPAAPAPALPSAAALPLAVLPLVRRGLCMLARPCLRQPQRASRFRFFDATVLVVNAGELVLGDGARAVRLADPATLLAVAHNVCADVQKLPAGPAQPFRSLYLSIAPEVVAEFYRRYTPDGGMPGALDFCRAAPLDDDLADTLGHCLRGLDAATVSAPILMHRLVGLLLALAARGIVFARPPSHSVGELLTRLLSETPGRRWTAAMAGQALAMSEATLRRRLAADNGRFDALLLEVRMHHAMTLLQTTRWSVQRIAEACGYRASARFALRFRARFGCSPSRVR